MIHMAIWPTHRRRAHEKGARARWARRRAKLERRAQAVKPNDRKRVQPKAGKDELDPDVWSRIG